MALKQGEPTEGKRQLRERQQDKMFSLIHQCQSGKESVKRFCTVQGIAVSAYYYWLKKYKVSRGMNASDFVPVRISFIMDEVTMLIAPGSTDHRLRCAA